jgi:hypothetical protein
VTATGGLGARGAWVVLVWLATLLTGPPARAALLDYEYDAAQVQLGRLRTLIERLSKQNVLYQLHLADQSKLQIIETAHDVQANLDLLHAGRPLQSVPAPPTPEIRSQLREIETAWVPLQRMALASPFDYLRRSREFIDPKDDRGDPLMILHFDDLARRMTESSDRASEFYVEACRLDGYEHCDRTAVAGNPSMLAERIVKEAVLVFAGLEAEQNRKRLAATRQELDTALAVTGGSETLKRAISAGQAEYASELWKDIGRAWRRLSDELELVIRGQAEEANLRRAVNAQILLVGDMQRLAVTLEQYAAGS